MTDLDYIVASFAEFARRQNLLERALEGCARCLEREANEKRLPRRLDPAKVRMSFRSHALTFESSLLAFPYISTLLDLYVGNDEIGWYKLLVRLNGEEEDDYLVFYPAWKRE